MEELVIRPSSKFIKLAYEVVILLIIGAAIAQNQFPDRFGNWPRWALPAVFALLLLWPASRHWRQRFTKMTMIGDKLRYETGIMSKSTRTIQLSKVQDVTVRQTLGQRVAGLDDLSIESREENEGLNVRTSEPAPV